MTCNECQVDVAWTKDSVTPRCELKLCRLHSIAPAMLYALVDHQETHRAAVGECATCSDARIIREFLAEGPHA